MIRAAVLALLVSHAAYADGVPWMKCNHCNASTGDQGSVAGGLAVIAGVAFAVGRRRR